MGIPRIIVMKGSGIGTNPIALPNQVKGTKIPMILSKIEEP